MNDIRQFLDEDHRGHLEHSAAELRKHSDRANDLDTESRKQYFYGITTVFPLMLLSHYYEWLTGKDVAEYMERFVPVNERKYAPQTKAMLECIYETPDSDVLWASAVSGYLATYPYAILQEFANWALTEEQAARMETFVQRERETMLPQLAQRMGSFGNDPEGRVNAAVYLGGDFPFELLERFHRLVVEP